MQVTITIIYNAGRPFDFRDPSLGLVTRKDAMLSDEHAAASYGLPVVLIHGVAHGPGDLPGHIIVGQDAEMAAWAIGWTVQPPAPQCATCGLRLDGHGSYDPIYCWEHDSAPLTTPRLGGARWHST